MRREKTRNALQQAVDPLPLWNGSHYVGESVSLRAVAGHRDGRYCIDLVGEDGTPSWSLTTWIERTDAEAAATMPLEDLPLRLVELEDEMVYEEPDVEILHWVAQARLEGKLP